MTTSRLGWRAWLVGALALNAFLLLAWSGQRCFGAELRALAATIPDDSFYYVLSTFRFGEHGFWTFDGEHETYGLQPVYAWFLTLLAAFFDDRFAFFRAALWTNYVLFVATAAGIAAFLYRLLRPCGEFRAALAAVVGAHGFLLNGTLLHGYTTLKENALYALLLIASLLLALHARERGTRRALLGCGLVTGLALSCRITPSTLLIGATTIGFAAGGLRAGRLVSLAGGVSAAILPWAIYSLAVHGRVLPTSGALKAQPFFDALRHGTLGQHLPGLVAEIGPYLRNVFAYSLGLPNGFHFPQGEPELNPLTSLFPCLFAGLAFAFRRSHSLRSCPGAPLVPVAIAVAALGTALNPIMLGLERMKELHHYYSWYIADLPVLLSVLAPMAVSFRAAPGRAAEAAGREEVALWSSVALAAGLVLTGVLALRPLRTVNEFRPRPDSWNTQAIAMVERANELLGPEARLGAYNAGLVGFLSEATVINFDGLANDDIIHALSRGQTILEYVRENRIDHLIDPLRPTGWFGNPFDRLELVAAVPFRLELPPAQREYYDGYYLLRFVDERFPSFDPAVEGGGVRVVPWLPEDPLGAERMAARCFRFEPVGGPAALTFHTLRSFSALRFRFGSEPREAASLPALAIQDDGGRVLQRASPGAPELVTVPCSGADWIRVEVTSPGDPGARVPATWLTDVSFEWEGAPAGGEDVAVQAYGEGCDARAEPAFPPPRLDVQGDVSSGSLRYVCTNAPPGAIGTLAMGWAPISKPLAGGCLALVERTSSTKVLQMQVDEHGRAALDVAVPAELPQDFAFAQVVFRDPADERRFFATTNGVRVLLRKPSR